jgi:hypothetical protein
MEVANGQFPFLGSHGSERVPARVNGQGPFGFALDTGASRTMLSSKLVADLAIEVTSEQAATGGAVQSKFPEAR